MFTVLKLIRFEQWTKNLLIFLVPIFGNKIEFSIFYDLIIVFVGFSLLASTGYIINDFSDLESDKAHYLKKNRVLASGKIPFKESKLIALISFVLGSIILLTQNIWILLLSYIYLLVSILYSKYLKYIKFFDVTIISTFFVLRTFLGSLGSGISISIYLLLMTLFSSLVIVFGKKLSIFLDDNIVDSKVKKAIQRNYSLKFLSTALQISIGLSLTTFNLWIFRDSNILSYSFVFSNILLLIFCVEFYNLTIKSKTEDFIASLKTNKLLSMSFIFFIFFTMFGILI